MLETIKISFIIPVYNSQDYLEECIDSIINQNSKEIEVILVDDGSTDGSGEICDKYSDKYSFIKTIHKVNEGVASARNTGIKKAVGDYIFFVDNDDWLGVGIVNNIIDIIRNNNVDLIINKYFIVYNDTKVIANSQIQEKNVNYQKTDKVLDYFRKNRINILAPWQYIVKRDVIVKNNILFDSSQNGVDDSVFSPILFCFCESIYFSNVFAYYWRQTEKSQGRSHLKKDFIEKNFSTFNSLVASLNKVDSDSKRNYIYFSIYKNIFSLFQFFKQYSELEKRELKRFFKKNRKIIKKSAQCSGLIHSLLFYLFGAFYGMLFSYNLAKAKGKIFKFIFKA